MDNTNNVAVQNAEEPITSQPSSPQGEVPNTEAQTTQEVAPQVGVSDVSKDSQPEDPREFQARRLAEENRKLKEELKQREGESAFDAFRPSTPPQRNVAAEDYQDPMTGELNWQAYNQALVYQAQQAAQYAAQQTTQEILDEQSARNAHPELFADKEVEQEIADRWFAARMRGENKSVSQIADSVARKYGKLSSKAEKSAVEKVLEEVTVKEQASMSAQAQTSAANRAASANANLEDLRQGTRYGVEDAIVARLKGVPYVNR